MSSRPSIRNRAEPLLARVGDRRDQALASPVHDTRTAAILGTTLGVSFFTCFLTGLLSHMIQQPPGWFHYPARPAGLYRVTQGLHVATGTAAVPLLLAKLWTVSPHLVQWPPVRGVVNALERLSLVPLVAGSMFMLWSGLANVAKWYPYPFSFVPAHFAVAWITIGALVVHIGAKISATRTALRRGGGTAAGSVDHVEATGVPAGSRAASGAAAPSSTSTPLAIRTEALSRRGFIGSVATAAGVLTVTTLGQTVRPLARLAVLGARRADVGIQGIPINRTARAAGVLRIARRSDYHLEITGRGLRSRKLSLADLRQMTQHEATLPITCVEGWSANARWRGVRMRDVLELAGAREGAEVIVSSMQTHGAYASSVLDADHATDRDTLLALEINGETLDIDHGYPLRLISPNRPGVMQTKWVNRLEVR